ncbi:MAG: hypothetical protein NC418_05715 [Muribaculaceae bacterium]|nr:hypothetical protein [Muribaculaceae bacterium]
MGSTDSKAILDAFFGGLEAVREEGLEATLRWTGEQLAAASDRLAHASADHREARAAELLVIAYPHVEALTAVGMELEAFATQNMAMLTVLRARVNPEGFASLWLQSLQALCIGASQLIAPDTCSNPAMMADIVAHTYGLFIATAHSYIPRFGCDDAMRRFYDHMRHMAAQAGEDLSHFRGHRMAPTLAIDVLTDNAARIASVSEE